MYKAENICLVHYNINIEGFDEYWLYYYHGDMNQPQSEREYEKVEHIMVGSLDECEKAKKFVLKLLQQNAD